MTAAELVASLRARDIRLWIERDRLRCSAPVGALDAEIRGAIAGRKEEILALLRHGEALRGAPRAIVPLKPDGDRQPLFAVPGHNGDVFCYVALARGLCADQPLLGVEPPGIHGGEPLRTVEALASYGVEQIRQCRPHGPYLIAGYCAGGTVAFEIARQLVGQGQEVALLALFGSPFPSAYRRAWQAWRWVGGLARRPIAVLTSLTPGRVAGGLGQLRTRARRRGEGPGGQGEGSAGAAQARTRRVEAATIAAVRGYRPRPYPGGIDLFLPSEGWRQAGLTERWSGVAGTVREHVACDPCRLDVMLREPYVATTAALLRPLLLDATSGSRVKDGALIPFPAREGASPIPAGGGTRIGDDDGQSALYSFSRL